MASGLRCAAAAVAVVALAACSGIPSGGPARVVRRVHAEGEEPVEPGGGVRRLVPQNPRAGSSASDIVRDYLTAETNPDNDYAIARRYLVPAARWDAGARTVVYTGARRHAAADINGDRATVRVTVDAVGTISPAGEYRPRTTPVTLTFRLRDVPGSGWRLSDVPTGLLLSVRDVATSFARSTLYWTDQARRLVPDLVFLRRVDQPAADLVRALLLGPRGWLAPAVRSAIPRGTKLLDASAAGDGVVRLNFSREIRNAPQESLSALVAQVVWTLTEREDVQAVQLLAEEEPLAVPGRPGLRDHRRSDWTDFAPVPPTADRRLFFVRQGVANAFDDAGRLYESVASTPALTSLAVNRGGTWLAGVTRASAGARQSLILVDLTGREATRTAVSADSITAPTWEPGGTLVWAVQTTGEGQQIVTAPVGGGPLGVVPVPASLPLPVTSLRLSPDGARVAIVAGAGKNASLWVARVERPASGGRVLGDPRQVVPSVRGVTAAAFDGARQLLFATYDGKRPALHRVDLDGFALETPIASGLPARPVTALTVSAGVPEGVPADRVVSSGGRLYRRTPGAEWAPLRAGGGAAAFSG
ncbi:MAG TPA: LpqB family beta-propeller domain-containing protein [Frankiaceae bacterium]|nr:LpqB family beta-propeller domain-containing protein [Frankiaceae bacterium]